MRTALFLAITQGVVIIPYRRFGTTHRSHVGTVIRILDHYSLRSSPEKRSLLESCFHLTNSWPQFCSYIREIQLHSNYDMFMIQIMWLFRITCCDISDVKVEVLDVSKAVIAITAIIIWQHRCSPNVLELKWSALYVHHLYYHYCLSYFLILSEVYE